ncbi:MAG: peptidoglycan DD-metalloendopeptidase family protein [Clostridia bacterium]|nr:peptidoglycan DD-metalloendopeptidase family protein [Clostridia bacterium]
MSELKKPSFIKGVLISVEALLVLVIAVTVPFYTFDTDVKAFLGVGAESFLLKEGHGLYIDGVFIAASDSEDDVNEALVAVADSVAESYGAPEGENRLCNEIKIVKGTYAKNFFGDTETLVKLLGETDYGFDYTVTNANGDATEVVLKVSTVATVQKEEKTTADVVTVETDLLPVGEVVAVSDGVDGVSLNEYAITYINGVQTDRVLLHSIVVTESVAGEQWQGTDNGATLMSVGDRLMLPCGGWVTSWYGSRELWGVQNHHSGLDFAGEGGSYGDPIYAAEDGIVSFAGWSGNYGNKITVDHSKRITTLYAHCSKIIVESGDVVRKGQIIGYIGNTGRVTGPHLHFEVSINGVRENPRKHLDWSGYKWAEIKN